jgi:hypothetical protein
MPPVKPELRATRVAKGLKVSQLAARVPGLTAKHLANCESGHGGLSIEYANAIATILERPVGELVELSTTSPQPKRPPTRKDTEQTKKAPKRAAA